MKKKDFDVITILIGIIVGAFIGYFIGHSTEDTQPVINPTQETGYVYLLQLAKYDNPDGAINFQTLAKNKGFDVEIVYDGVYYIYGAIGISEESLSQIKLSYEAKGYSCIVRKEYMLDLPNFIIDDQYAYDFYLECINNLINSLSNEQIIISDKYYIEPVNLELFSTLTILQTIQNSSLKARAQLQAYRLLVQNLK